MVAQQPDRVRGFFVISGEKRKRADGLGQHIEAGSVIDAALVHCDISGERWCLPELLRVKALVTAKGQGPDALDAASAILEVARTAARQDSAAGWERRINLDLEALGHEPAQLSGAAG